MTENVFPQLQQVRSFWENAMKDNVAAVSALVDAQVQVTKATFSYVSQVSEQLGKLATEATGRFTKTA